MGLPAFPVLQTLQTPPETWAEQHRLGRGGGAWSHSAPDPRALPWPPGVQQGLGGRPQPQREVGRRLPLEIASDSPTGCLPQSRPSGQVPTGLCRSGLAAGSQGS